MPPRKRSPRIIATLVFLGSLRAEPSEAAVAGATVTFPFEDQRYLQPGEADGGLVYVTEGALDEEALPLVVYLHGLNERGPVHYWYGLFNKDLRRVADDAVASGEVRPFVLAAPSQTRDAATPGRMWDGFDLDAFVDATEASLPAGLAIDREAVVVVGHSGGGCNLNGGLLGTLRPETETKPLALIAVDTCLDATIGRRLGALPEGSTAWVYYQPYTWPRDVEGFSAAFLDELERGQRRDGRIVQQTKLGPDPHNAILERALRHALPEVLPAETAAPYE